MESISTALGDHRQSSGGTKSYSNVGSTLSPRDITCMFHTASMKHSEIKLSLARDCQPSSSSVLTKIISTDRLMLQTRKVQNLLRDLCPQSCTSMNQSWVSACLA